MRKTLLIVTLFAMGCATSKPQPRVASVAPLPNLYIGCVGHDSPCTAELTVTAVPLSKDRKERQTHAHTIYGHCEIVIDQTLVAGQTAPLPQACLAVKLSLFKKTTDEQRIHWVDGNGFKISGLTEGIYHLKAYSEQFQTSDRVEKIRPGQEVVIQIKLARRATASSSN